MRTLSRRAPWLALGGVPMARQQLAEAVGTAQPPKLMAAALRRRGEVLSRGRVTHFLSSSPYKGSESFESAGAVAGSRGCSNGLGSLPEAGGGMA